MAKLFPTWLGLTDKELKAVFGPRPETVDLDVEHWNTSVQALHPDLSKTWLQPVDRWDGCYHYYFDFPENPSPDLLEVVRATFSLE